MFLKRVFFFAAVIAGALACSQIALAQDETQESSPLSITTQVSRDLAKECQAGKGLVAQFSLLGYATASRISGHI
jgi:hypothetical protein